ncbi:hypothetical protein ASF32_19295 [Methylobacterium sp. Leaf91]|nr:hypothetical protein ASF32_19295 [Methylobacterium sp. Leaf91]
MPRWLQVALTLVLFTAVMLAVGWVLRRIVPPFNQWLGATFGELPSLLIILGVGAVCSIIGLWPRDESGRMKRLTLRR